MFGTPVAGLERGDRYDIDAADLPACEPREVWLSGR